MGPGRRDDGAVPTRSVRSVPQSLLQRHVTPEEPQGVVVEVGRHGDPDEMRLWFKFGMSVFPPQMRLAALGRLRTIAPPDEMPPAVDGLQGHLSEFLTRTASR